MRCPNCNSENNEGAKFCKKCGAPLKNQPNGHETLINSMNESKSSSDDKTKIIIVALVIVAVVLAGAFAYIYGFGNNQANDSQSVSDNQDEQINNDDEAKTATQTSNSAQASTQMEILGGSFETGGGLEDKTYASIYVGPEFSGENVKIQIYYSRDGSTLNNGNMVPKTVDSSGYINVRSADAYKYFPDHADINLYDSSGNLLDTQSVNLSPEEGTQTF